MREPPPRNKRADCFAVQPVSWERWKRAPTAGYESTGKEPGERARSTEEIETGGLSTKELGEGRIANVIGVGLSSGINDVGGYLLLCAGLLLASAAGRPEDPD